tara:strand:- start:874 stop:1551 length:678 start_codon:yes stop_codon:yes gene_type:complete
MINVGKNKTRKKKRESTDIEQFEEFRIKEPTLYDYMMVFGHENGPIWFVEQSNNNKKNPLLLYKIPLNEKEVARIDCAHNNSDTTDVNIRKRKQYSDIIMKKKLYKYAYINLFDCKHEGNACEIIFSYNDYHAFLDKSNMWSRLYDENVAECVEELINRVPSPKGVDEVPGFEGTGGKRRSKTKKSKKYKTGRTIRTNKRTKTKKKTNRNRRKTINGSVKNIVKN